MSLVALTAASVHIACKFAVGRKFKKRIERVAVAVYLNLEKKSKAVMQLLDGLAVTGSLLKAG